MLEGGRMESCIEQSGPSGLNEGTRKMFKANGQTNVVHEIGHVESALNGKEIKSIPTPRISCNMLLSCTYYCNRIKLPFSHDIVLTVY